MIHDHSTLASRRIRSTFAIPYSRPFSLFSFPRSVQRLIILFPSLISPQHPAALPHPSLPPHSPSFLSFPTSRSFFLFYFWCNLSYFSSTTYAHKLCLFLTLSICFNTKLTLRQTDPDTSAFLAPPTVYGTTPTWPLILMHVFNLVLMICHCLRVSVSPCLRIHF